MTWTPPSPSHVDPAKSGSDHPVEQQPDHLGHLVKEGVCSLCTTRIAGMGPRMLKDVDQAGWDRLRARCSGKCSVHGKPECAACFSAARIPWRNSGDTIGLLSDGEWEKERERDIE